MARRRVYSGRKKTRRGFYGDIYIVNSESKKRKSTKRRRRRKPKSKGLLGLGFLGL